MYSECSRVEAHPRVGHLLVLYRIDKCTNSMADPTMNLVSMFQPYLEISAISDPRRCTSDDDRPGWKCRAL